MRIELFMRDLRSLALLFCALPLAAAAGTEWETVASGALVVRVRDKEGTPYKEVWAEGEIAAPVREIQATLMSPDRFPQFMPYVKEAGTIEYGKDGNFVYTRLDLPFLTSRDYVLKVSLVE